MKVLVISNIPSPYRIDFFNELGKMVELYVIFEAKSAKGIKFNWNINSIKNFKAIFLKDDDIQEKKINWNILRYLKRNKFDIIIVTSYAYFTEMIAILTLKLKKIPYILEVDGGLIRNESRLKKWFKSQLISNAIGYFSPSKVTDLYLLYYGANKQKIYRYPFTSLKEKDVLNNVIDINIKIKLRKKLRINEKKMILTVGQFIYRKGFDVLLKSCKQLSSDVGIYIVGGKPTNEYLELKHKYGINNIHFEGFKTKEELSEYYKAADIFVLPTREDIWGLVINEAMAFGLPVVTTNKCVAGLELIENGLNGYIIPTDNSNELFDKIKIILENENVSKQMASNNLRRIQEYTIENMANVHLDIFEMLRCQ